MSSYAFHVARPNESQSTLNQSALCFRLDPVTVRVRCLAQTRDAICTLLIKVSQREELCTPQHALERRPRTPVMKAPFVDPFLISIRLHDWYRIAPRHVATQYLLYYCP